jgi:hypothetical protein
MKIFLALTLLFCSNVFAQGGASTVGDGGHCVVCEKMKPQLLDLYEFAHGKKISLPEDQSVRKSYAVLLERASHLLQLNHEEANELALAAKRFIYFKIDPWEMNLTQYSYFLNAKDPIFSGDTWNRIEKEDCYFQPVVIRPDHDADSIRTYESLCHISFAGLKHCFLVDMRMYRRLSRPQQACLVLHETLRFLPRHKKLSEVQLRQTTARLCTQ